MVKNTSQNKRNDVVLPAADSYLEAYYTCEYVHFNFSFKVSFFALGVMYYLHQLKLIYFPVFLIEVVIFNDIL